MMAERVYFPQRTSYTQTNITHDTEESVHKKIINECVIGINM